MSDLISRNDLIRRFAYYHAHSYGKAEYAYSVAVQELMNSPAIDAIPVVRCKDCKNRGTPYSCPMRKLVMPWQGAGSYEDCTADEGYCHMGVKKDGGAC